MGKTIKGDLLAQGKRFGIVVSRFNEFISSKILEGAIDTLVRQGANEKAIDVAWAPGSFEIPFIAKRMAATKRYDAVVCLGVIIRGSTPHFEYVANEAAKGIARASLDTNVPCIFGVITAETLEQAIERAGAKEGNKGRQAALVAIEMANLQEAF
ncbi:MAG: 6,7-dimethyl-8-ribityllumazine synthase [Candidatus Omnitrophota bacterium]